MGMTIKEVAERISVSCSHLEALEANDFAKLPPEIYVKGFLGRYCDLLEIDKNKAFRFFDEKKIARLPAKKPVKSIIAHVWFSKAFSYRNFAILLAFLFLAASVFYISKSIYPLYAKPAFKLLAPSVCPFHSGQEKLELKGIIQPESKIWINDEEALVDKDGNFECFLFLKNGENTVRFKIINKFGKERREECVIQKE